MGITIFRAFTDRNEANAHIRLCKLAGENVVEVSKSDVVEIYKRNEEVAVLESGPDQEWILVLSTSDKIITPSKPNSE